jgi:hypothetical protein
MCSDIISKYGANHKNAKPKSPNGAGVKANGGG